jgi:LAO/AO transport system kinase
VPVSPLEHRLHAHPGVRAAAPELEEAVLAAQQLLETFLSAPGS